MLLTAVPFFVVEATWRLPDTYHSAGSEQGTATLKFYENRDILATRSGWRSPVSTAPWPAIISSVSALLGVAVGAS